LFILHTSGNFVIVKMLCLKYEKYFYFKRKFNTEFIVLIDIADFNCNNIHDDSEI